MIKPDHCPARFRFPTQRHRLLYAVILVILVAKCCKHCTADISDLVNQAIEIIRTNRSADLTILRGIADLSGHIRNG